MPTSTLVLVKNKTINCAYVIFDLSWWKIQYPKKSLCCFRDPKKSRRLSQTQKNPFWPKCQTKKNPSDPPPPAPSLKYVSGAPGTAILSWPIVRGLSSYTVQTHVRLDVAQPRSRGSLLLVMSQERRTLGPGKIGGSLRSKRFRASSSRTSGREKKKRDDGGGGGERRN